MSVLDRYRVGAQRRLDFLRDEVRDEPWREAYREAERCHFFEMALDSTLSVLRYIRESEKSWREAVYRGVEQFCDDKDGGMKKGFALWLDLAAAMEESVRNFERLGYNIEQAAELRQAIEVTRQTLSNWTPPLPSRSPSMLAEEVSEAEADALRALLDAPAGSPGKFRGEPLTLPEGDPSLLR